MLKNTLMVINSVVLVGGIIAVSAQEKAPDADGMGKSGPVKYEAEDGLPKDKLGEKRRDYAVLEAALNDLASPKNPEYKYHSQKLGREVIIDNCTYANESELGDESNNIDNTDTRSIPADIQEDFKRRNDGRAKSLKDFRPANPNIIVRDLDKLFEEADDPLEGFRKIYPTALGFVWAYQPGYSKDGKTAAVLFMGGPNGVHGLSWVYMLTKRGKRWEVKWRHCCPRE